MVHHISVYQEQTRIHELMGFTNLRFTNLCCQVQELMSPNSGTNHMQLHEPLVVRFTNLSDSETIASRTNWSDSETNNRRIQKLSIVGFIHKSLSDSKKSCSESKTNNLRIQTLTISKRSRPLGRGLHNLCIHDISKIPPHWSGLTQS